MMKGVCPHCEKETMLEKLFLEEVVSVRGEDITVPVELFRCTECGEDFENPTAEIGPVELAYQEYRKRKGLLLPSEIKDFRSHFGLTQSELGKLLGFGGATISRYENGALQDDAHDKTLRLAMSPGNLLELVLKTPEALIDSKRQRLVTSLKTKDECASFQSHIERLGSYEADELSGFREFDITRFVNAVLLFCVGGKFTTVLNKLLFYGDFLHSKVFSVSITGLRYAHMDRGPAPDKYYSLFAFMAEEGLVEIEEIDFGEYSGEKYHSKAQPDRGAFSDSELLSLLHVKKQFANYSATQLSEHSHREAAFKETKNGELISYSLADHLSLEL